jgi:hypothetical protein
MMNVILGIAIGVCATLAWQWVRANPQRASDAWADLKAKFKR